MPKLHKNRVYIFNVQPLLVRSNIYKERVHCEHVK